MNQIYMPKCHACGTQLYGFWNESPPIFCRKCRLEQNPLTQEKIEAIFASGGGVEDVTNTFFQDTSSGKLGVAAAMVTIVVRTSMIR